MTAYWIDRHKIYPRSAIALFMAFAMALSAHSQEISWTGGVEGDWGEPANWDLGRVPAAGDTVVVNQLPAPRIGFSAGDVQVDSVSCNGTLLLRGGSLTLFYPSQLDAGLYLGQGAALTADGPAASLNVTGTAHLAGGDLIARNGATITLPAGTLHDGGGLLLAEGSGSILSLAGISSIGIPAPGEVAIDSAESREISVFVGVEVDPGPDLGIANAESREFSVFNGHIYGGGEVNITEAESREFSVFNGLIYGGGEAVIPSAGSREFSVFNGLIFGGGEVVIPSSESREFSVFNGLIYGSGQVDISTAESRELSVDNSPATP